VSSMVETARLCCQRFAAYRFLTSRSRSCRRSGIRTGIAATRAPRLSFRRLRAPTKVSGFLAHTAWLALRQTLQLCGLRCTTRPRPQSTIICGPLHHPASPQIFFCAPAVLMNPVSREQHDLVFGCLDDIKYIQVTSPEISRAVESLRLLSSAWEPRSQTFALPTQDYLLRYFFMLLSPQGLGLQVSCGTACMHVARVATQ
jgi:hypothetical protein